jgi:hypothetical protein
MNTQSIHRPLPKPPLPILGLHTYSGAFVHILVSTVYTHEPTAGPIVLYSYSIVVISSILATQSLGSAQR